MKTTPSNDFSRTGAFTRLAFTLKRVFFLVTVINGVSGLIFLSQQVFGSFNEYKGLAKRVFKWYFQNSSLPGSNEYPPAYTLHCTSKSSANKTSAMLHVDCINPTFTRTRLACAKSKSTEQNQKPSPSLEGEIENMKYIILLEKRKKIEYENTKL